MASGLQSQIGFAEESVYGTLPGSPSWRFYELLATGLEARKNAIQSDGIRPGGSPLRLGQRRVISSRDAGGGGNRFEVPNVGFGILLKHIMGGTVTSTNLAGTPAAWQHVFPLATTDGKSLDVQIGVPRTNSGTVDAYTYYGAKITDAEFAIAVDQMLTCELTMDAQKVDRLTALATATYPAAATFSIFNFSQGAISVGGSALAKVTNASWALHRSLKTDRYFIGSAGLKDEPVDNDFATIDGRLTVEYTDPTIIHDRFVNDTPVALQLVFTGATISGANPYKLQIDVPEIRFEGETPKVGGRDLVTQDATFNGWSNGSAAGMTVTYVTSDTAP
jgi:Phage tail tube protein